MSKEIKVELGQELPREDWLAARDALEEVFGIVGEAIKASDEHGDGEQAKESFYAMAQLALQAMTYVAEFATDKCRIIVLPEESSDGP